MIIFETARLVTRRYTEADADDFYRLNGDPDVMQYIRAPKNYEDSKKFLLENIAFYGQQPLFGRWALLEKETGHFVGSFAIIPVENSDEIQIGYALLKASWGKGYATEALEAGLRYAFGKTSLERIVGITEIPNIPSQKVLLKCGFTFERNFSENGKELSQYVLYKKEYFTNRDEFFWEKLQVKDADLLAQIASKTYGDHYIHLWLDGGDWYINKFFTVPVLKKELANKDSHFFIAHWKQKPAGYLKVNINKPLDGDARRALELERIYLFKDAMGSGIGRQLLQLTMDIAMQHGSELIWLKTMDSSYDAIAFYKKAGFESCGSYQLDYEMMKKEYRGMLVMKKEI